ncbi:MAG: FMN-binding protein [Planctomycetota bacterium]
MKDNLFTIFYITLVATFFTACVAVVHSTTRERIRLNEQLAERRVILKVLRIDVPPDAKLQQFNETYENRVKETGITIQTQAHTVPVLEARSADGEVMGYAFKLVGQGFWDTLRGYMAIEPDLKSIRGLSFYEQSETPGLGAEITEPWFEEQFRNKTISRERANSDDQVIRLMRAGREQETGDVDAVTGATETSKRVERIIDTTLKSFLTTMRDKGQSDHRNQNIP